jgi:bacillithiol system protein YtxJ
MHPHLKTVEGIDDLDDLLAMSNRQPVLLFKHSYTCGISAEALDELVAHLDKCASRVQYAVVIVQTHRDVSNEVSRKLGVRHETPQALLICAGRAVWIASHFRVTAEAMQRAIAERANA